MTTYYKGTICIGIETPYLRLGNSYCGNFEFDYNSVNNDKIMNQDYRIISKYIENNISTIRKTGLKITSMEINSILKRILYYQETEFCNYCLDIIYEKFEDIHGNYYGKELLTGCIFPIYNEKKETITYYLSQFKQAFDLEIIKKYKISSIDKCESIIEEEQVADNNEVIAYIHQFDKGINKRKKKKQFTDKITELFNKNVFNEEIKLKEKEKKEITKQTQSVGTQVMENIEYLLTKLSEIDINKYNEYKAKYELMLLGENIVIEQLAPLEGEIEFYLMFNKKGINNIKDYLEQLKIEYLENNLNKNNTNTSVTLDDIDKIEELFLKSKNDYSLPSQRKILKDIAFIYLMEAHENIDNISIERLRESYFSTNLKSIIIIIKSLRDLEIIENDLIIDLNDNITLEHILDIIKRIKFNNIEKESVNTLIKRI